MAPASNLEELIDWTLWAEKGHHLLKRVELVAARPAHCRRRVGQALTQGERKTAARPAAPGGRTKVARECETRRNAGDTREAETATVTRKPASVDPLLTFMVRRGSTVRVRQRASLQ